MLAGRPLSDQLRNAIQDCDACVFIATRRSVKAPWCLAELGAFWGARKLVVVYVAEPDVLEKDFPPQFKGTLWTDDINRVIKAVQHHDLVEDMPQLSGGMIYILRELALRGWA
jgi:thioesterase domain-containing protein